MSILSVFPLKVWRDILEHVDDSTFVTLRQVSSECSIFLGGKAHCFTKLDIRNLTYLNNWIEKNTYFNVLILKISSEVECVISSLKYVPEKELQTHKKASFEVCINGIINELKYTLPSLRCLNVQNLGLEDLIPLIHIQKRAYLINSCMSKKINTYLKNKIRQTSLEDQEKGFYELVGGKSRYEQLPELSIEVQNEELAINFPSFDIKHTEFRSMFNFDNKAHKFLWIKNRIGESVYFNCISFNEQTIISNTSMFNYDKVRRVGDGVREFLKSMKDFLST